MVGGPRGRGRCGATCAYYSGPGAGGKRAAHPSPPACIMGLEGGARFIVSRVSRTPPLKRLLRVRGVRWLSHKRRTLRPAESLLQNELVAARDPQPIADARKFQPDLAPPLEQLRDVNDPWPCVRSVIGLAVRFRM